MRGKISRSLERKYPDAKPPIPLSQAPLVCLSPTPLSPSSGCDSPFSLRSPSPQLPTKRKDSPLMGPLDRPPSPSRRSSVGRIPSDLKNKTVRSRDSSPIRRRTPSPKRDRALVLDKNGRKSLKQILDSVKRSFGTILNKWPRASQNTFSHQIIYYQLKKI